MKEVIAIDGPAGAGKSTVARKVAEKLGWQYIDTGAMYRALTLKVLREGLAEIDPDRIVSMAKNLNISLKDGRTFLDGEDVSEKIRTPEVDRLVPEISKIPEVRKVMVELQRKMGKDGMVVLDGRDIGSVVFPDAKYKFYLDASPEVRAERILKDSKRKRKNVSFEELVKEIKKRDEVDSKRSVSPLRKVDDAIYIDTSKITVDEVVERILEEVKKR